VVVVVVVGGVGDGGDVAYVVVVSDLRGLPNKVLAAVPHTPVCYCPAVSGKYDHWAHNMASVS